MTPTPAGRGLRPAAEPQEQHVTDYDMHEDDMSAERDYDDPGDDDPDDDDPDDDDPDED